ncbi:VOC family protein [Pseudomonadota bacterium AL_CKDN230030165-1A_HGKHYDSX7]
MSQRLDHVVIAVRDLDAATAAYERLGFTLTPRGHHSLGSSNNLAIFANDYLELLGVEPRNAHLPTAHWGHPPGLVGLVFKSPDADALWAQLRERGVGVEGEAPREFHRPVELPDGSSQDARFRTVRIAPERIANGRVFLCQHLTPELVWQPAWQDHPNGVIAVGEYAYVSTDTEADAAVLRLAFPDLQWRALAEGHGLAASLDGGADVRYLTPEGFEARYGVAPAAAHFDGTSRAAGLTLVTRDLPAVRALFRRQGVRVASDTEERIVVAPAEAEGVALAFRAA